MKINMPAHMLAAVRDLPAMGCHSEERDEIRAFALAK